MTVAWPLPATAVGVPGVPGAVIPPELEPELDPEPELVLEPELDPELEPELELELELDGLVALEAEEADDVPPALVAVEVKV